LDLTFCSNSSTDDEDDTSALKLWCSPTMEKWKFVESDYMYTPAHCDANNH
jgi:hypothetical protein